MRGTYLVIFVLSYSIATVIISDASQLDSAVTDALITKVFPNSFDDKEYDFKYFANNDIIEVYSEAIGRKGKLKLINSSLAQGVIPFAEDWEIDNNVFFNNLKVNISMIGGGYYMGGEDKELKKTIICKQRLLNISNMNKDKNKHVFIAIYNSSSGKFFDQYYGEMINPIKIKNCRNNEEYISKMVFFSPL